LNQTKELRKQKEGNDEADMAKETAKDRRETDQERERCEAI